MRTEVHGHAGAAAPSPGRVVPRGTTPAGQGRRRRDAATAHKETDARADVSRAGNHARLGSVVGLPLFHRGSSITDDRDHTGMITRRHPILGRPPAVSYRPATSLGGVSRTLLRRSPAPIGVAASPCSGGALDRAPAAQTPPGHATSTPSRTPVDEDPGVDPAHLFRIRGTACPAQCLGRLSELAPEARPSPASARRGIAARPSSRRGRCRGSGE